MEKSDLSLSPQPNARQALVVGAGLAGAAICVALARRGWLVHLVDAAASPAKGASALPVGMLSPHVTRAPTPLSRLCALGVADARVEIQKQLQQGQGWQACEVDNLEHDRGRWPAAMVRPGALVQAWLQECRNLGRLQTHWSHDVARLRHASDGRWQALNADGQPIAQANAAVVACAHGAKALLADQFETDAAALPLRPVKGVLSLAALSGPPLAPRPMRNKGVFMPSYQDSGLAPDWPRHLWAMGSTYERGADNDQVRATDHELNASHLEQMHPQAAQALRQAAQQGRLLGWAQVRCASLDRLPLVGAVPDMRTLAHQLSASAGQRGQLHLSAVPALPGLHLLCALGSRGLTLAHWCANLLAAQMCGQPSPLCASDQDLAQALNPARFAWKLARRPVQ